MRYVVANKEKALDAGVLLLGHLVKEESIILNEKEVMCLSLLMEGWKIEYCCWTVSFILIQA